MRDDKSGVYAVLITTLVAGVGVLWRGTSLRAAIFRQWRSRADEIRAGLTQGAIDRLVRLQEETIALLGSALEARFTADPGRLAGPVNDFRKAIKARDRFSRRVAVLLWVGPVLAISALVYLVGWSIATAYFVGWSHALLLRDLGWAVGGLGTLGVVVAGLGYVYLVDRVSHAEQLSYDLTHVQEPPVSFPGGADVSGTPSRSEGDSDSP